MLKIKIILSLMILSIIVSGQDFRRNSTMSLFSDQKANRIGDAITIWVVEASEASNGAETSTGKKSDLGFNLSGGMDETSLPNVDFGMNTGNEFQGSGSTKTKGMIRTKISARIDSVLVNGDLLIRGSRKISINGEETRLFIKGIVRASDIRPDNSVLSYNISEAEFIFDGSGMIARAQEPGWLTKFFHWLF
jgi:flagellar L-ring protein precursor FlgH